MKLYFEVPGQPVPKGRPRMARGRVFTPQKTVDGEAAVREACVLPEGWPLDQEYELEIYLHFKNRSCPDGDNCEKLIIDALNGKAWFDDRQVYKVTWWRFFDRDEPRTHVHILSSPVDDGHVYRPRAEKVKKPRKKTIKPRTIRSRRKKP